MMQFPTEYIMRSNRTLAFVAVTTLPTIAFLLGAQKCIVNGLNVGAVRSVHHKGRSRQICLASHSG